MCSTFSPPTIGTTALSMPTTHDVISIIIFFFPADATQLALIIYRS